MSRTLLLWFFAWVLSLCGFLGSIVFGELHGNYPCLFCWGQRLCMFPLTYLLGLSFYRNDQSTFSYVIFFPILGALLSSYHTISQYFPELAPPALCGFGPSCAHKVYVLFDSLTMPMLSQAAFFMILGALLLSRRGA